MKKIILSSIFISAFILLGSVYQASALANPASVKCNLDGGVSVTQKDANGGEYSNCKFPDGSVCEEWAYYRGECSPKKPLTLDQLSTSCTSAFDGCNNCFRASGGQWACTMMACMGEQKSATCKNAASDTDTKKPAICTKEYAPVCGKKKITTCTPSIPASCSDSVENKTYSNKCMMQADGASLVSEGACADVIPVVGQDICSIPVQKLTRGKKGDYVRSLQRTLSDRGYNTGAIDGVFGRGMISIIKDIQSKNPGLKVDGVFGKKTRDIICSMTNTTNMYTAIITKTPNTDLLVGGSAQYKDVELTNSSITTQKTVDVLITYDSYAIVPNAIHTKETKKVPVVFINGKGMISKITLGPVLSITIDGVNVPFQEK